MLSRIALLSAVLGLAFAASVSTPTAIEWSDSVDAALACAKDSGSLVVVHFSRGDRPVDGAMRETTFADPGVIGASRRFEHVRVDAESRPELFERLTGERGALATCVLDGSGATVAVQRGYAGPREYVAFLGRVEREVGAWRAARATVAADPRDASAQRALGEVCAHLGREREAEECFARALELARESDSSLPVAVRSLEGLARLEVERGRSSDARRHLAELRRVDPRRELERRDHTLLTEVLVLFVERKITAAAALLEECRASCSEPDRALLAFGEVSHESGAEDAALVALRTLVQDHPDSPWRRRAEECIAHIENPQWEHAH